ncbi:sensor histidine kinase [Undibacterium sp. SXout7W]|uniref:sensor histidine kinase n=1 Tax=Undibacterium sp. SXout7W TaxID=3413049 RepID=UPI003BF2500F
MISLFKRGSRTRLSTLLTGGVTVIVIVTVLSVLALVDHFANNYAQREAEQRLRQLSWQMRDELNLVMQKTVGDAQLLSNLDHVKNAQSNNDIRNILENLQRTFSAYAWIGLAGPDGTVLASTQGLLEGQSVSQRPWFQQGQKGIYFGDYHPALLLEKQLPYANDPWRFVDIAIPIFRSDGSYRGVIGAHLSWHWVRNIAKTLLVPADKQYAVEIMIVRSDGTVILGPKNLEENKINVASLTASRKGKSGAIEEVWADGETYLTGYALSGVGQNYPAVNWSILVRQRKDTAMAAMHNLEREILLLGGILGAVLAFFAAILARKISSSLMALSASIEAHGSKQTVAPIPIIEGFYEAHLLSVTLTEMVQKEEQYLKKIEHINASLESTVIERTSEIEQKARQLEIALEHQHQTQKRLQAVTDNLPSVITFMDKQERYLFVNEYVTTEFGIPSDYMIGKTLREIVGEKFYAGIAPYVQAVLRGEMVSFEGEGVLNKRYYFFQSIYVPARNNAGEIEGFYAMTFDIADRKRIEAIKNEFVSTVSHELRTPLTSINGALRLIDSGIAGDIPTKVKELTTVAMRNADRLLRLINDILDMEKFAAGKMEFNYRISPLHLLIQDAISTNTPYAEQFGIQLEYVANATDKVETAEAAVVMVRVDIDKFNQVLTNLLSNAIKFSRSSGVVKVRTSLLGSDTVKIIVEDNGCGIPAHFHDRIFKKFSQINDPDHKVKGGTGLGLNISKTIIEHMGGNMGFHSEAGIGSQFFFTIPIAK